MFQQLIPGSNPTSHYLTLYTPMHVSAGDSGNKSLPDPIPYPCFQKQLNRSRYCTFYMQCYQLQVETDVIDNNLSD